MSNSSPSDGINWSVVPEWQIHQDEIRYYVRVHVPASTYEYCLFKDKYLTLWGHYNLKDKLIGYSLVCNDSKPLHYFERPWYVGIFTNVNTPNRSPQQVFADTNVRLFKFNKRYPNYAFAIRWRVDPTVTIEV